MEQERVNTLGQEFQYLTHQFHIKRGVYSGKMNKLLNSQCYPKYFKMQG